MRSKVRRKLNGIDRTNSPMILRSLQVNYQINLIFSKMDLITNKGNQVNMRKVKEMIL